MNRRTLKWRRMATFLEDEEAAKARMEERIREQQKTLDTEFGNIQHAEAIVEQQNSAAFIERMEKVACTSGPM
jgi:inorganic triphosphatase YgiF